MAQFDVAIYPVMKAWGFTDGNYQVPDTDALKATLELVDPSLIDYDKETSTVSFKKDGVQIDLGGIARAIHPPGLWIFTRRRV